MARKTETTVNDVKTGIKYLTPEAQENRMISLSMDLAERQLREGTASAQVITHFLKLGTEKAKLEEEMLKTQKDLMIAKIEAMESTKRMEELYSEAISAMKHYGGNPDEQDVI